MTKRLILCILAAFTTVAQADVFTEYTEEHPNCVYGEAYWDGNSGIAPYVETYPDGRVEEGWSIVVADDDGKMIWGTSTTEPPPGFKYKMEVGQGLDIASTAYGITFAGLVEANPAGLPLALAIKGAGYAYLKTADAMACYEGYTAFTALGMGAGVWNLGLIAGAGLAAAPVAIAMAVATAPSDADKFWACAPVPGEKRSSLIRVSSNVNHFLLE